MLRAVGVEVGVIVGMFVVVGMLMGMGVGVGNAVMGMLVGIGKASLSFSNIIPAESASVKTFIFVQISPGRACEIRRKKVYYKRYVSPEEEGQDDDQPHPRMLRRP